MLRHIQLEDPTALGTLELKLSPTPVSVAGLLTESSVVTLRSTNVDDEDPLPQPEPAPPPYPGDDPPIDYPLLPPSGPAGPGS
jgi:hypothetical protein